MTTVCSRTLESDCCKCLVLIEKPAFTAKTGRAKKMSRTPSSTSMTLPTLLLTFLLCLTADGSSASQLCAAGVCVCDEDTPSPSMDCSRTYLSIVPPMEDWVVGITHMDLSSNNISSLGEDLSHNTLQVLDLSHNYITSVVQNAFGGLSKLKYLNLAGNAIRRFEENGFYGLDHLQSLNLSGNGLAVLPDRLFYNFIGLKELSLRDNPLVHIDPIHFNRMTQLRWLDLSDTDLYALPANIFHTTGQLEFLDLSGNDFHDVPTDALRSAQSLRHLVFSENPVDVLNRKSFIKMKKLEVLELSNMPLLSEVQVGTFSDLADLAVLEMRNNRQLKSVHKKAFEGLFNQSRPVLQELDLEGNRLEKLDKDLVQCAKMRKFNIQRNPWFCDCTMKWLKHCQIQKIYAADLMCAGPEKVANAMVEYMTEDDFSCDYTLQAMRQNIIHHEHVVRTITLGLAAGFLVILAFGIGVILKWKDLKTWYRSQKKGPGAVYYVRARANPREI